MWNVCPLYVDFCSTYVYRNIQTGLWIVDALYHRYIYHIMFSFCVMIWGFCLTYVDCQLHMLFLHPLTA